MSTSDAERERVAQRILVKQRRRIEERRRLESLSEMERRIRCALDHARALLDRGASPERAERETFDSLPEDAEPIEVVRAVRRIGTTRCHGGTWALIHVQSIGFERGRRAGAESAERLRAERDRYADTRATERMRAAGLDPDDWADAAEIVRDEVGREFRRLLSDDFELLATVEVRLDEWLRSRSDD